MSMWSPPTRRQLLSTAAAAVAALAMAVHAQTPAASAFVPIFDGTLDKWTVENTQADNFNVEAMLMKPDEKLKSYEGLITDKFAK